jgi:chemotaxis protein methyltransferase CheR
MHPQTFEAFRQIIHERSGISLKNGKEALVSARVAKRIRSLGLNDCEDYLDFLHNDSSGRELIQLIDAISTNVTSFFREADHFNVLRDAVQGWVRDGQRRIRMWSAAASTGEEPYSMAMVVLDALENSQADFRLLATDISTRVLESCARGVYGADKLRTAPPQLVSKYFSKMKGAKGAEYAAGEALKSHILFRRLNLATPPYPMQGPMDVVFCRNVMIYFDNDTRSGLLNEIHRLLKPGGYLMVGHAESLAGLMRDFKVVAPSVYLKPK